jgi:hypothetical protein
MDAEGLLDARGGVYGSSMCCMLVGRRVAVWKKVYRNQLSFNFPERVP